MGLVKHCYIGRCKTKSKFFAEIRQNEMVHDKASDEEVDGIDEEELVGHEVKSSVS